MIKHNPAAAFPLVEKYYGVRLGVDLASLQPGRVAVVESPCRLRKEQSYGYIRALWWLWLEDGRSVLSVPPGVGDAARRIAVSVQTAEELFGEDPAKRLKEPVNAALRQAGLAEADRVLHDLIFACNAGLLRPHRQGDCRRLTNESVPPAEGMSLPTQCFPDGIAYGVIADGKVASIAFAHRTGVMEGVVADLGVGTAAPYRRRGYAKTAVSAVVEHVTSVGGEALYGCDPSNAASIATARSVGFVPYGASLILSAPRVG
jgi:GNAT superfamily N-acetyltransferase